MEELDKMLAKVSEALTQMATTHGPDAVDLTLEVVRLRAINNSIMPLLAAIACLLFFKMAYRKSKERTGEEEEMFWCAGCFVSGALGTMFVCISANIPAWVGIFDPKVYLAYTLLSKIM